MTDAAETFVAHEACPECGSQNNLARYADGHAHCFSEGCDYRETAHTAGATRTSSPRAEGGKGLISYEFQNLSARSLTEDTCRKFSYGVSTYKGKPCQVATYKDANGHPVAQKVRFPDKTFTVLGDSKKMTLYGQHLWKAGGRKVVVTEGEIDALSVSQAQDNRWPVVSIPNGAQGAVKAFRSNIEWLSSFDQVIIMFDMDAPGQDAAEKCAAVLPPGKAHIASLPEGMKDANDMLKAGKSRELISAVWEAKQWRPDGIIESSSLFDQARKKIEWGKSWPWPELTNLTYGIRRREIYGFGGGTGTGKTELFKEIIEHVINVHNDTVGVIFLEEAPQLTLKTIAGKVVNKRFHMPDTEYSQEELDGALKSLDGKLFLYDHWGSMDWGTIKSRIRYMVTGLGIKDIFLDHLTALAAAEDDDKKALDRILADFATLAQELDFTLYYISHLATPDGKPHEEGGRVMLRHFRGSRAIGFWTHFAFGLERDQQAEDESERNVVTLRVLKDRYTGKATGATLRLVYDTTAGRMIPTDDDFKDEDVRTDHDLDF